MRLKLLLCGALSGAAVLLPVRVQAQVQASVDSSTDKIGQLQQQMDHLPT
jgi:hypothetical protein